jgi:hypothetical protein
MQPILPFWFKQRQARLEPAGENTFKAVAPQQGDAYLLIRQGDNQLWSAAVRLTADGEDVASTRPEFSTPGAAWDAAFELYRRLAIV